MMCRSCSASGATSVRSRARRSRLRSCGRHSAGKGNAAWVACPWRCPAALAGRQQAGIVEECAGFDCTMRMTISSLSMSAARGRTTSLARSPQPRARLSIVRAFRLVAMVRTRLTSSGLSTGGRFCGSLMCPTSASNHGVEGSSYFMNHYEPAPTP